MSILFYRQRGADVLPYGSSGPSFATRFWHRSGGTSFFPPNIPFLPTQIQAALQYSLLHALKVLKNDNYSVCSMYDGGRLAHISFVYPGYFRFPFMSKDDLQIGATWTQPLYRGQGLATKAIQDIMLRWKAETNAFWYLCDSSNAASLRAAQNAGLARVGDGRLKKRFGLGLLGEYEITRWEDASVPRTQACY